MLDALKASGYVRVFYRDGLRGFRLTKKAKEVLTGDNNSRFSFFFQGNTDTNMPKSEVTRRLRLHRLSETYITMLSAGVSVYRDIKPNIFYADGCGEPESVDASSFYGSREVKELGDQSVRIRGSRAVGTLLTPNDIYVVYNSGNSLMKWGQKAELRYKTLMRIILCQQRLPEQYRPERIHGLMLGDNVDLAYKILTSTGGVKRSFYMLDDTFEHFHFLTSDCRGEVILRLLCDRNLREQLHASISRGLLSQNRSLTVEHDATEADGTPVLFAYSFNLPRIARFNAAADIQNRTGTIICFDYQADVLRQYCGESITLKQISFEKFERRFLSKAQQSS